MIANLFARPAATGRANRPGKARGPRHALLAFVALTAAGCSSRHEAGGQVLAVVGGAELTAPMLDAALSTLPADMNPKDPAIQKATLERLVSEMLLARQAEELKLDKRPSTVRAIESRRRQILADAYLRDVLGEQKPSDVEVVNFFSEHPYLFADRRRYGLSLIQVNSQPQDVKPYLASFARPGMTVDALAAEMNAKGVAAVASRSTIDADQLPDQVARNLTTAASGTNVTYRQGDVQNFIQIDSIAGSPVPLAAARASISRYLQQKRRAELVDTNLRQLRAKADVQFIGTGRAIVNPEKGMRPAGRT